LPAGLDEKHQPWSTSWRPCRSEFDDTYLIEMVKAFKDELAATHDADIQSCLTQSIPVVEAHLKQVAGRQKSAIGSTSPNNQTP